MSAAPTPATPSTAAVPSTRATPARRSAPRSRWLALGVLATSMLTIILDGSVVTVAMPAIQSDLGFSPVGLSWVVNAYASSTL